MLNDVYTQQDNTHVVSPLTAPENRVTGDIQNCTASDLAVFSLRGQKVTYESELTEPLEAIKDLRYQQYLFDELSASEEIMEGLIVSNFVDMDEVNDIFNAAKNTQNEPEKLLQESFNKALSLILKRLNNDMNKTLKVTGVSERLSRINNDYSLYGLGVMQNNDTKYSLTLYAKDFMQHINSELFNIENNSIRDLYATILQDMLKFAGIWQHNLIDNFDMRHFEQGLIKSESVLTHLRKWCEWMDGVEPDALLDAFKMGLENPVIKEFVNDILCGLEMQFDVDINESETWEDQHQSILDTIKQVINVSSYAFIIKSMQGAKNLEQTMSEQEKAVHKLLTELTVSYKAGLAKKLNKKQFGIPDSMEPVGESMPFLGFVVQADNDNAMGIASQDVYQNQMEMGEADEAYAIDLSNKDWYSDLLNFTIAINTLLIAVDAVSDLLLEPSDNG